MVISLQSENSSQVVWDLWLNEYHWQPWKSLQSWRQSVADPASVNWIKWLLMHLPWMKHSWANANDPNDKMVKYKKFNMVIYLLKFSTIFIRYSLSLHWPQIKYNLRSQWLKVDQKVSFFKFAWKANLSKCFEFSRQNMPLLQHWGLSRSQLELALIKSLLENKVEMIFRLNRYLEIEWNVMSIAAHLWS